MSKKKKPNNYWNKERCYSIAKRYKTIATLRNSFPTVYSKIKKEGWWDLLENHRRKVTHNKYTRKEAIEVIKRFDKLSDFKSKEPRWYSAVHRYNWQDLLKALKSQTTAWKYYSDTELISEAQKYKSIRDIAVNKSSLLKNIKKRGLLAKLKIPQGYKKTPSGYWTEKRIMDIASDYSTLHEFRKKEPKAYSAASRLGLSKKLRSILDAYTPVGYWTKKRVLKEAKKYKRRVDFWKNSGAAYNVAKNNKYLDEACNHMRKIGNKKVRALYVFEFGNNSAYVGLTYDYEQRYSSHMTKTKKIIRATESFGHEFIMYNEWMDVDKASREEKKLIKLYKRRGWKLLNSTSGGETGGQDLKYKTKKYVKEEAKKYNTRNAFREGSPGAYNKARRENYLDECCTHMKSHKKSVYNLTKKEIISLAKTYQSVSKFYQRNNTLWRRILSQGWEVEIRNLYPKKGIWTKERVFNYARKAKSRAQFGSSLACKKAKELGVYKEVEKMLPPKKTRKKYSDQEILKKAKSCKTSKEFSTKYPKLYHAAHKRGLMKKCSKHFKSPIKPMGYWSEARFLKEIKSGKKLNELHVSLYDAALNKGWIKKYNHLVKRDKLPNGYWTKERCKEVANKYSDISTLRKEQKSVYSKIKKEGWWDLVEHCDRAAWNQGKLKAS